MISFTLFLRRDVVARVGPFDERLGLGSGTPWSSGEELDYVLRAIQSGARIVYDPDLTVTHARKRHTGVRSSGRSGTATVRASDGCCDATATTHEPPPACCSGP